MSTRSGKPRDDKSRAAAATTTPALRTRVGKRPVFVPRVVLAQSTDDVVAFTYAVFITDADADVYGFNNDDYQFATAKSGVGQCVCRIYIAPGSDGMVTFTPSAMLSLGFNWPGHPPPQKHPTVTLSLLTIEDEQLIEPYAGQVVLRPFALPKSVSPHASSIERVDAASIAALTRQLSKLWRGSLISADSTMIIDMTSGETWRSIGEKLISIAPALTAIGIAAFDVVSDPSILWKAAKTVFGGQLLPGAKKVYQAAVRPAVPPSLIGVYVSEVIGGSAGANGNKHPIMIGGKTTFSFLNPVVKMDEAYNDLFGAVSRGRRAGNPGGELVQDVELVGASYDQYVSLVDAIVVPLLYPKIFFARKTSPPKGVLLYGPPGTGKTFLVKKLAASYRINFDIVTSSTLSTLASEMEKTTIDALSAVFARAVPPAVIFFDEFDGLFGTQSAGGDSQQQVNNAAIGSPFSLMTHLLTLMDGFGSKSGIIVVGATNRPESLDAALRRPGRFDTEIAILPPDAKTRKKMLVSMLSRLGGSAGTLALTSQDLDNLVEKTRGFTPADIDGLARAAVQDAIDKSGILKLVMDDRTADSVIASLTITAANVAEGLRKVTPSTLRGVDTVIVPDTSWSSVGGSESLRDLFRRTLQSPLKNRALDESLGLNVNPVKGILLWGPPGTGKTVTARAVATDSGYNFIHVKSPSIFSKFVGASEATVRGLFANAKAAAPCIIFFDEIDAIAGVRGEGEGYIVANRVVTTLLTEIDELEAGTGVVVMAATNRPKDLDPAVTRPGRFDLSVYIGLPNLDTRIRVIVSILARSGSAYAFIVGAMDGALQLANAATAGGGGGKKSPKDARVGPANILFKMATLTQGCTQADINEACRVATADGAETLRGDDVVIAGPGETSRSKALYQQRIAKILSSALLNAAAKARHSVSENQALMYESLRPKYDALFKK